MGFLVLKKIIPVKQVLLLSIASLILFESCGFRKNHIFLQPQTEKIDMRGLPVIIIPDSFKVLNSDFDIKINPGDRLSLKFLNNEDISPLVQIMGNNEEGIPFVVDNQGNITLPIVGRIKASGYTVSEITLKIEQSYSGSFKEPKVEVKLLNQAVTVMGEVRTPGIYPLVKERMTIFEMIGQAGGVTNFAYSKNIRIVRMDPRTQRPMNIVCDLTNPEVIANKEIILRPKDIIIVEPTKIRIVTEAVQPYTGFLSILATIVTLTLVIINISQKNTTP